RVQGISRNSPKIPARPRVPPEASRCQGGDSAGDRVTGGVLMREVARDTGQFQSLQPPTPRKGQPMNPARTVTDDILAAFLKCRYKAYLKLRGASGERSDYERSQATRAAEYRAAALEELLRKYPGAVVVQNPPDLPEALRSGASLIVGATASDA